ncbi:hypothetical protein MVEN_00606500 [Mycena venus]|uniref:Uncharacterized protein n=1 Tax=Mycena venus TaxID=2733690 RepID=A0A8H7D8B6_9AGAR|nr:hypothetical protein MVEN_00606500 [Mycena venus]
MHSRLVNAYSYYATVADPNKADGIEGRVNEVDRWFKSSPVEWFSTNLGPINDNKAGWRKIGDDSTEILFEYNNSVPSPILDVSLSNDLFGYAQYDFTMQFSYPDAPARRNNIAAREFWDTATDYQPVLFNNTARTLTAETDACTGNVSVTVVDAAGVAVGSVSGVNWVQYTVPTDAVFPLRVTMSSPGNGNATAELSDVLGITYATGPNGPDLATTSNFRVVFCLSEGD